MCALLLIGAPAANAGGWAVTYVDPVPSIQPSTTHTVGYWVLQHGTRPYAGDDLGRTGLRFRSGADERVFIGVPLGQPAHYAVTFALPAGVYEVFGVQGVFPDHALGTLTVPGTLLVKPVESQMIQEEAAWPWEEIAPPLRRSAGAEPTAGVEPAVGVEPIAGVEPVTEPVPVWVVGLVVVAAAGVFLALRKRFRPGGRR
ncbi:hypothetical protein SAMN05216188_102380 [Lentzea xinjiangensis]|uniref:Uncharacterized protein n=2 Tax=Lentzea xinjiangensis TaxID=402600 RepID=A0A1H9E3A8_9PSEU|nr:hypothetical protein SAMN05216188_102380 [Lentzea xinjiangensis]